MKAAIYGLDGKKSGEIELPKLFSTAVDKSLIKRAVLSIQSSKIQPKGPFSRAGLENSAVYRGSRHLPTIQRSINVGHARLPRTKERRGLLQGRVAKVPEAVGGKRAHPLKPEKLVAERINKKEKKKATESAIAATTKKELVSGRGHLIGKFELPLIVENKLESLKKTKDVIDFLKAMDIFQDVERAKNNRKIRSGKGKRRGRKYKRVKSVLFVAGESTQLFKAARNIEGVDIVPVNNLNADLLAPGTEPGRLTVWTENAVKKMK